MGDGVRARSRAAFATAHGQFSGAQVEGADAVARNGASQIFVNLEPVVEGLEAEDSALDRERPEIGDNPGVKYMYCNSNQCFEQPWRNHSKGADAECPCYQPHAIKTDC